MPEFKLKIPNNSYLFPFRQLMKHIVVDFTTDSVIDTGPDLILHKNLLRFPEVNKDI